MANLDERPPATAESPSLTAARARGAAYVLEQLNSCENLLPPAAASFAGLSIAALLEQTEAGDFYAFKAQPEVLRFPQWQFAAPLAARQLLVKAFAGRSTWAMHLFTSRPNMYLDNQSPREYVMRPDFNLDALRRAVGYRLCEHQGGA